MKRFAAVLAVLSLAGCYNPRYPSEGPGTDRPEMAPVSSPATGGTVNDSSGQPVQSRKR